MINAKDKERIKELKELISKYDKQYYELGVSDISDAVKALFQVEAHRIKVVKMSSKEDGT